MHLVRVMTTTCSWCHESNEATVRFCKGCGHEAHRPRMHCGCDRCAGPHLRDVEAARARLAEHRHEKHGQDLEDREFAEFFDCATCGVLESILRRLEAPIQRAEQALTGKRGSGKVYSPN